MSLLLYCILRGQRDREPPSIIGIGLKPVVFVTANGLSAAVSHVDPSDLILNCSQVLAYEKVIAFLHRTVTVIPMRYGCVLDKECRLTRLLEDRQSRYMALLKELDGHVEMGIRILPDPEESSSRGAQIPTPCTIIPNRHPDGPGRDYLAAQRTYYAGKERIALAKEAAAQKVRAVFAGLFSKCREERHTPSLVGFALPVPMISLYFLVPMQSVEKFRGTFQSLAAGGAAKLLLSGPWAPYNFVVSEAV